MTKLLSKLSRRLRPSASTPVGNTISFQSGGSGPVLRGNLMVNGKSLSLVEIVNAAHSDARAPFGGAAPRDTACSG